MYGGYATLPKLPVLATVVTLSPTELLVVVVWPTMTMQQTRMRAMQRGRSNNSMLYPKRVKERERERERYWWGGGRIWMHTLKLSFEHYLIHLKDHHTPTLTKRNERFTNLSYSRTRLHTWREVVAVTLDLESCGVRGECRNCTVVILLDAGLGMGGTWKQS